MFAVFNEDRQARALAIAGLSVVAVVAVLHLIVPVYTAGGGIPFQWLYNLLVVAGSAICTVVSYLLWQSAGRSRSNRLIWAAFGLGYGLWFIGDLLFAFAQLILNKELLFPSFADVSFSIGYIPLALAMFFRFQSLRVRPDANRIAIAASITAVIGALLIVFGVVPAVQDDQSSFATIGISLLYPIGDLLILLGAALVFITLEKGYLALPWVLVAAGVSFTVIADLIFIYSNLLGLYVAGTGEPVNALTFVTEVTYLAAYLTVALGFFLNGRLQRVF